MRPLAAVNLLKITPQNHCLHLLVYKQRYEYNLHANLCLLPASLRNLTVPTSSGTSLLATTRNI
jgi:hypothetical protein